VTSSALALVKPKELPEAELASAQWLPREALPMQSQANLSPTRARAWSWPSAYRLETVTPLYKTAGAESSHTDCLRTVSRFDRCDDGHQGSSRLGDSSIERC
jgi:hypothetical protein